MKRIAVICMLLVLVAAHACWARVGGGSSFSAPSHSYGGGGGGSRSYGGGGGSRSYGGGGGGGGSHTYYYGGGSSNYNYNNGGGTQYNSYNNASSDTFVLWRPVIVILLVGLMLVLMLALMGSHVPTQASALMPTGEMAPPDPAREGLRQLREQDPNFSEALFLDFAQLLYTRFHESRPSKLAGVRAYIADGVRQRTVSVALPTRVEEVVVGKVHVIWVSLSPTVDLSVEFESNYTDYDAVGRSTRWYAKERWIFRRKAGVISKSPEQLASLSCPCCGSTAEPRADGTCQNCGQIGNDGSFSWVVNAVEVVERCPPPPIQLDAGAEAGMEAPTLYPNDFDARRRAFLMRNADFNWDQFEKKVRDTFLSLQQAWSCGRWEQARSFETDHLFSMHRYWMENYRAQGLTNRLENIQISQISAVNYDHDAFYESVTVRIFASMKDYVVNQGGQVVGGNPQMARAFSEYWTFMRRSGKRPATANADPSACPSCGAPLEINMAGICSYCNSKLCGGDFDWVLSSIDQDETYAA